MVVVLDVLVVLLVVLVVEDVDGGTVVEVDDTGVETVVVVGSPGRALAPELMASGTAHATTATNTAAPGVIGVRAIEVRQ